MQKSIKNSVWKTIYDFSLFGIPYNSEKFSFIHLGSFSNFLLLKEVLRSCRSLSLIVFPPDVYKIVALNACIWLAIRLKIKLRDKTSGSGTLLL